MTSILATLAAIFSILTTFWSLEKNNGFSFDTKWVKNLENCSGKSISENDIKIQNLEYSGQIFLFLGAFLGQTVKYRLFKVKYDPNSTYIFSGKFWILLIIKVSLCLIGLFAFEMVFNPKSAVDFMLFKSAIPAFYISFVAFLAPETIFYDCISSKLESKGNSNDFQRQKRDLNAYEPASLKLYNETG